MENNRFNKRIQLSQSIVTKIAKIDQFNGQWKSTKKLSPTILSKLKSFVIITSTGASTRIEGVMMTDVEIERFLRGLHTTKPQGRDEEEVAGYADVIGRVFDNWKTISLTEGWVLQFHDLLLQFSTKDFDHKGRYKSGDNTVVMVNKKNETVVLFSPTPPFLVAEEMRAIIDWTQSELAQDMIHPILVIANFIFEFLAIHPFQDGNGRLSRVLTNLLLLKSGYSYMPYVSLDEIIEQTKANYYIALRATQKNHKTEKENILPWAEYFVESLLTQTKNISGVLTGQRSEKLLSQKQELVYGLFTADEVLSVADILKKLNNKISRDTIKQSVSRLVTLELLEKAGQARGTRYSRALSGSAAIIKSEQEIKNGEILRGDPRNILLGK